ncbi:MAG: peptidoglycan DD-metalloendopeptidase family protein, partial [Pseudomonadota bacterium]
ARALLCHIQPHSLVVLGRLAALGAGRARAQQRPSEIELAQVRERIEKIGTQMAARTRERSTLQGSLAESEQAITAAEQERRSVADRQRRTDERLRAAEARLALQRQALRTEQAELARQVRAAYMSGQQERLKLLLSQGSPAELGRLMADYGYLNRARLGNLDALASALAQISATRAEIDAEVAALARLARDADALIERLRTRRDERRELLARIDRELSDQEVLLRELNQREQDLAAILAELSDILAGYPVNSEVPLRDMRGELTWPVAGDLSRRFGERRRRGLTSKGVVLTTDAGADVRSIYHGRVAFADWLPGLGLLMIIDHGDDLLSLYGYNETLQKTVGDWVAPGELIATVGNSGGQRQPGLYFELRRGTEALNPDRWFRNRPSRQRR